MCSVSLQVLAWSSMATLQGAREALPCLITFVFLSNLGASITEFAKDLLVAEYGQRDIESTVYNLMLLWLQQPVESSETYLVETTFLAFTGLLSLQLIVSLSTREESFGLPWKTETRTAKRRLSNLAKAIQADEISKPLIWLVASIGSVPLLSGSIQAANMCPQGCEGSVTSFLASTMCLSQIVSAFLGVGLANLIGKLHGVLDIIGEQ